MSIARQRGIECVSTPVFGEFAMPSMRAVDNRPYILRPGAFVFVGAIIARPLLQHFTAVTDDQWSPLQILTNDFCILQQTPTTEYGIVR